MNVVWLIAKRELSAYLRTWTGYIIIAPILAVIGLLFYGFCIGGSGTEKRSAEVLSQFYYMLSGGTMVAAVLLSMRLLSEEQQTGTINLLYSSPVKDWEIVLGKYLSALAFLTLMTATSVYMPLLILVHGKVSWGHVFAGYFGITLLGSATLAIGILGSTIARSQVVAAILNACMTVALLVVWFMSSVTERPFSQIMTALALHGIHFRPFQAGLIHVRDVAYYGLTTFVFLFLATRVLEARRWK